MEAVQLVYKAAGGGAAYQKGPLDRCLRDILTANQHVVATARTYEMVGRLLLGLEPLGGCFNCPWKRRRISAYLGEEPLHTPELQRLVIIHRHDLIATVVGANARNRVSTSSVEDEGLTLSGFVPRQAVVAPTSHAERSAARRRQRSGEGPKRRRFALTADPDTQRSIRFLAPPDTLIRLERVSPLALSGRA